jgi:hypothetical protein
MMPKEPLINFDWRASRRLAGNINFLANKELARSDRFLSRNEVASALIKGGTFTALRFG